MTIIKRLKEILTIGFIMTEKSTNKPVSPSTPPSSSSEVITRYDSFIKELASRFPKVDQRLLLDIIHFQTSYKDWEGSVLLKLVYPKDRVDMNLKKDSIYKRYQRVGSIEEHRTLRLKVIRMYLEELEKLLIADPEIEYVTGSATLTPSDAYSA